MKKKKIGNRHYYTLRILPITHSEPICSLIHVMAIKIIIRIFFFKVNILLLINKLPVCLFKVVAGVLWCLTQMKALRKVPTTLVLLQV